MVLHLLAVCHDFLINAVFSNIVEITQWDEYSQKTYNRPIIPCYHIRNTGDQSVTNLAITLR